LNDNGNSNYNQLAGQNRNAASIDISPKSQRLNTRIELACKGASFRSSKSSENMIGKVKRELTLRTQGIFES